MNFDILSKMKILFWQILARVSIVRTFPVTFQNMSHSHTISGLPALACQGCIKLLTKCLESLYNANCRVLSSLWQTWCILPWHRSCTLAQATRQKLGDTFTTWEPQPALPRSGNTTRSSTDLRTWFSPLLAELMKRNCLRPSRQLRRRCWVKEKFFHQMIISVLGRHLWRRLILIKILFLKLNIPVMMKLQVGSSLNL